MRLNISLLVIFVLSGCLGMPNKVTPVEEFNLNRYLGTWYEIARLDHSFEHGLSRVSANYSLKEDGGVRVINRGYFTETGEWNEAVGKAYFVDDDTTGYFKVSFFGPFYGSYVIFELDKTNYQYAFVSGPNNDYLWLLSRTVQVEQSTIDKFISLAREKGFDTDQLIFVEHK